MSRSLLSKLRQMDPYRFEHFVESPIPNTTSAETTPRELLRWQSQ
jgi:hypothetical protein